MVLPYTYNMLPPDDKHPNISFYEVQKYNLKSKGYEPVGGKRIGNEESAKEEINDLNDGMELIPIEIIVEV